MNVKDIKNPTFLKGLSTTECIQLAEDIRSFLIDNISKTGGHLSSNLGIVELTIALHKVFDSPKDKIFFDVGHQSYIHKILTGRAEQFSSLRQYNGLSGFQKRNESEHDVWEAGHSSTSLSAAMGMAIARDLNHETYQVIPVVGDGSLFNGMSFEALNHIGFEQKNMIIIFNDNNMSISQNIGGLSKGLNKLRTSSPYTQIKGDMKEALNTTKFGHQVLNSMTSLKNTLKHGVVDAGVFGEFDLEYIGPVDGHDIKELVRVLEVAKEHEGPIVVHVLTKKGKGYSFCENDVSGKWHGTPPFNPVDGKSLTQTPFNHESWSEIIANGLIRLASHDEDICVITPAMIQGSKLETFFSKYPNRSFDCGIAEEHAMTMAAGLGVSGKKPFVSIYSSFLQRAYDQVNHDICRMNLPCVIGIDRAGLVGEDGETHHGVFDIAILRSIPNLVMCQPKDANEAQDLLYTGFESKHPYAIRYPRGSALSANKPFELIEIGSWTKEIYNTINDCTILAYGPDVVRIKEKIVSNNLSVNVINARFFKPLDEKMIQELVDLGKPVIIYETDMLQSGLGSAVLEYLNQHQLSLVIHRMGIDDQFVKAGSMNMLRHELHLDYQALFEKVKQVKE